MKLKKGSLFTMFYFKDKFRRSLAEYTPFWECLHEKRQRFAYKAEAADSELFAELFTDWLISEH